MAAELVRLKRRQVGLDARMTIVIRCDGPLNSPVQLQLTSAPSGSRFQP